MCESLSFEWNSNCETGHVGISHLALGGEVLFRETQDIEGKISAVWNISKIYTHTFQPSYFASDEKNVDASSTDIARGPYDP